MKLIVVDTETSDLPERGGKMIELAFLELTGPNWETTFTYETFIEFQGMIDPRAQAMNHIRPEQLLPGGIGVVSRERAVAYLMGRTDPETFLVAHNVAFDSQFFPDVPTPWICTLRSSRRIWPEAPGHSNQVLRYWLNITPDFRNAPNVKHRSPHEAFYDVVTTTGILRKMLERYTPTELRQMTISPFKLNTINFGKHKGQPFDKIPRDYLVWLRGQDNLDSDLKYTIDSILHG